MKNLDIATLYKESGALLEGHFLLSSGRHSRYYLQSAKVLESPATATLLVGLLAKQIHAYGAHIDTVCSPALGGILAGYELARALGVRFIFTERVQGVMQLRRGFSVFEGERFLICEDIITTGGSALEAARAVEALGGEVVAFAALANRGVCKRMYSTLESKPESQLPSDLPLFALDDFVFDMYAPDSCPLCQEGSEAIKPGSRGN